MEIKKLNYGWGVKLAVLLIICVQYTVTITSPILGTIMEAFPEHASMVKLLETIPTFATVIISILLGPLMKVFYKKQLLLFGIALSFFQRWLEGRRWVYPAAVLCTGVFSVLFALKGLKVPLDFLDALPLADVGLGWVLPAGVGVVLGLLLSGRKR